jgi:N-terminal acetyltransferase B complex catalytic subunit
MYESMGYSVFRRVQGYYSGGVRDEAEDAFGMVHHFVLPRVLCLIFLLLFSLDMRKSLSRDKNRISVRDNGRNVIVMPEDCWP